MARGCSVVYIEAVIPASRRVLGNDRWTSKARLALSSASHKGSRSPRLADDLAMGCNLQSRPQLGALCSRPKTDLTVNIRAERSRALVITADKQRHS